MVIFAVRYCYLIVGGEIRPVFATWILFALATTIGIWTYLRSADSKKDLITNIANTTDVFVTWSILIFLLLFGKKVRYDFSTFEVICILGVIAILIYWKVSQRANMANIAVNVILAIGYLPTIAYLWRSTTNTESFFAWIVVLVSSLIALYNPIRERNWLALLYASRAVVSIIIIISLMIRIEFFR